MIEHGTTKTFLFCWNTVLGRFFHILLISYNIAGEKKKKKPGEINGQRFISATCRIGNPVIHLDPVEPAGCDEHVRIKEIVLVNDETTLDVSNGQG